MVLHKEHGSAIAFLRLWNYHNLARAQKDIQRNWQRNGMFRSSVRVTSSALNISSPCNYKAPPSGKPGDLMMGLARKGLECASTKQSPNMSIATPDGIGYEPPDTEQYQP